MERSVSASRSPFFWLNRNSQERKKELTESSEEIRLSFDTMRVQSEKPPKPIGSILLNASYTEELSFQPTVRIPIKTSYTEVTNGATIATRIGRMDYHKSQALVLFSISGMGLIIGLLISIVLL